MTNNIGREIANNLVDELKNNHGYKRISHVDDTTNNHFIGSNNYFLANYKINDSVLILIINYQESEIEVAINSSDGNLDSIEIPFGDPELIDKFVDIVKKNILQTKNVK